MSDGYLFPTPGFVLSQLVDELAEKGEEFTEHQATIDIMLAVDRGDVKPLRYYSQRWDWSKSKVHRRMDELKARAADWRAFNLKMGQKRDKDGTAVGQTGTAVGQKTPESADKEGDRDTGGTNRDSGGTAVGQEWDSIVQSTDKQSTDNIRSSGARVRVDSVDSITTEILDTRLRGLTQKDKIQQVCERHGQAGWDVLREVCQELKDNDWSVNGSVILERLRNQIQMLNDSDEPDGFEENYQRIYEAARRGAGLE